jgi:hypothetical protein
MAEIRQRLGIARATVVRIRETQNQDLVMSTETRDGSDHRQRDCGAYECDRVERLSGQASDRLKSAATLSPSPRYGRRRARDRRVRDAGSGVDLRLVKALVREELSSDRIELGAVLSQQSPCFGIALVGNPPDFLVHRVEQTVRNSCHPWVALRR